ncbi:MAG: hypothetical protein EZS28_003106, partial [Streblomastix strix]
MCLYILSIALVPLAVHDTTNGVNTFAFFTRGFTVSSILFIGAVILHVIMIRYYTTGFTHTDEQYLQLTFIDQIKGEKDKFIADTCLFKREIGITIINIVTQIILGILMDLPLLTDLSAHPHFIRDIWFGYRLVLCGAVFCQIMGSRTDVVYNPIPDLLTIPIFVILLRTKQAQFNKKSHNYGKFWLWVFKKFIQVIFITIMVMQTRSKNSKQGSQRRQQGFGLMELLVAYLLLHPGQTTITSREFGITTQQTYTIVRCYCRQTSFKIDSLRMPSYITREKELRLAQSIHQRILNREALTVDDVRQEIINQHIQERRNASARAEKLGLFSLVNEFRSCLPDPSSQYVFNFVHRHNITFSLQQCQDLRRFEASFSSNIDQWFRCVYQPAISTGVRARSVFDMNETSVNWDIQQRTAKQVGTRIGICIPSDNVAGHISMVPTISPGSHQPPTLFIIGLLKKVPDTLLQLPAAEDCQFEVSDSGFMNMQLF